MTVRKPVWVEPVHGHRTPMCEAIAVAGGHVNDWAQAHQESFPPIVINITDGFVTDSPYEGASLYDWAQRLSGIATLDGGSLLFNVFVSPDANRDVIFPAERRRTAGSGTRAVPHQQRAAGADAAERGEGRDGPRPRFPGFAFNVSNSATLVKILEIGTRVTTQD